MMLFKALLLTLSLLSCYVYCQLVVSPDAATGLNMNGAVVQVVFSDNTIDELTFAALPAYGPLSGGVVGTDWSLVVFGNTISAPWLFTTSKEAQSLDINLAPGNAVWDIGTDPSTANSFNGLFFTITTPVSDVIIPTYSGIPQVIDRQSDIWSVLDISFPNGFIGFFEFEADTDLVTTVATCVLADIQPLEVDYIPHLASNTTIPIIRQENNATIVHLELQSRAADNRRTGINAVNATWIVFGAGPTETTGCVAGVDYNWVYSSANFGGECWDIYSLDIDWTLLTTICPLVFTNDPTSDTDELDGLIRIRTITDHVIQRGSGVIRSTPTSENSQEGFTILFSTSTVVASASVRTYAPVEVTAVITDYEIPQGNVPKTFTIETTIQDPDDEGFSLVYNGGVAQVDSPSGDSLPPFLSNSLDFTFSADSVGYVTQNGTASNGDIITLAVQSWTLTISILDPTVCVFSDLLVQVPFTVVCNDPDPQLCPLTANTSTKVITLDITTDNFCASLVANYSFSGSLTPYLSDFSAVQYGFFEDATVGWEIDIQDLSGNNLDSDIASVEVVFLSAAIGDGLTESDLLPDGIYTLIANSPLAHIITGSNNGVDVATEALYQPITCASCAASSTRFLFTLSHSLWPIPADEFSILYVAAQVELTFTSKKKSVVTYFQGSNMDSTNSINVQGPSTTTSSANGMIVVPIAMIVSFIVLVLAF